MTGILPQQKSILPQQKSILPQQKSILTRIRPVRMLFSVKMCFQAPTWELIPHGGGLCPHTPDRAVAISRM